MRKYNYNKNGFEFMRIPKNKAKAAYNNGLTVVFCPCNLRPGTMWGCEIDVNIKNNNTYFDTLLNEFEYYNCINSETGFYTAFYIPVICHRYNDYKPEYNYNYLEV